jgi:uncharacterized protein YfiM (DUF2279 family)
VVGLAKHIVFVLLFFGVMPLKGQILPPDSVYHPKRLTAVVAIEGTLYVGSFAGLYAAWYSDYATGDFHLFNDNAEWLQVDKAGHSTTSYFLGKIGYDMLRWSGVREDMSLIFGGGLGFIYQSTVEVFDGFSRGWGFSWGDMAANAFGTALFIGQQAGWKEQRFSLKFSYHSTGFPQYRPELLGETALQSLLKDYNGQTYWLSANIASFLPAGTRFPQWLNVAFGYGAEGMLGGFDNPADPGIPQFDRYRQYYLSLDVDLTRIPVKNKVLKSVLNIISFIKVPFPAVEFNKNGVDFHPLYF